MATHPTICKYYGSMKGCWYGHNCKYIHANPESIKLCKNRSSCRYGLNCAFRHPQPQATVQRVQAIRDEGCWAEDIIDFIDDGIDGERDITLSAMKQKLFPELYGVLYGGHCDIDRNSHEYKNFDAQVLQHSREAIVQKCVDKGLKWAAIAKELLRFDEHFRDDSDLKRTKYKQPTFARIVFDERAKGTLHKVGAWKRILVNGEKFGVFEKDLCINTSALNYLDAEENLRVIPYDSADDFIEFLISEVESPHNALSRLHMKSLGTSPTLTDADVKFIVEDDALVKMTGSGELEHICTILSNIHDKSLPNLNISDLKRHGITNIRHRRRINSLIMKIKVKHKQPHADNIMQLLNDTSGQPKSAADLINECKNEQCCLPDDDEKADEMIEFRLREQCGPFNRIHGMLMQYKKCTSMPMLQTLDPFLYKTMTVEGAYPEHQMLGDFLHVKRHVDTSDSIAMSVCEHFRKHITCDNDKGGGCRLSVRHRRERNTGIEEQKLYDPNYGQQAKDCDSEAHTNGVTLLQLCDTIHNFFLHSPARFGRGGARSHEKNNSAEPAQLFDMTLRVRSSTARFDADEHSSDEKDNTLDEKEAESSTADAPPSSDSCGGNGDQKWWSSIDLSNPDLSNDDDIYAALVKRCGVFRWQNTHGFASGTNRAHYELRPRFENVKEEVLQNPYCALSIENWNQTLRKSTTFHDSFFKQTLRSKYAGRFNDQITKQSAEWDKGEDPKKKDIVTLKLYTDYDRLQFELKKCFRFETIDDIAKPKDADRAERHYAQQSRVLIERLQTFYHWRGALLICLEKYGRKLVIDDSTGEPPVLYHGVNTKMIIKPTPGSLLSGPLSTSASYHVARQFATDKGFVLKISSQYPRMRTCHAFDASPLSDYPEEQEWLIGSMHARVLEVIPSRSVGKLPIASEMREVFFAVHLFREQMFTMSEHLAHKLVQFLKVLTNECCDAKASGDSLMKRLCQAVHQKDTEKKPMLMNSDNEQAKKAKMIQILWHKFDEFRKRPNSGQRIKFDIISNPLKRFFMEQINETDITTGGKKWTPSFDRISTVFPGVREIHFKDKYRLDERVLQNLIRHISARKNDCTLQKVHFLYYKYQDTVKPGSAMPKDDLRFKNPDTLERCGALNKLGWIIKHGKGGGKGYKIRLERAN